MDDEESIDDDEPLYFYRHGPDGDEEGPETLSRLSLLSRAQKRALFVRRIPNVERREPSAEPDGVDGPYRTPGSGASEEEDEEWIPYQRLLADARDGGPERLIGDATIAAIRPLVLGVLLVIAGVGMSFAARHTLFVGLVIAGILLILRTLRRWVNGEV